MRDGVPNDKLLAHVRCHVAFGATYGRGAMPHCPLYFRGLQAERVDAHTLTLTTTEATEVARLRKLATSHVPH